MEIVTRAQAKAAGLKRYFTGKPCKHGHITERYIAGRCVECLRIRDASPAGKAASAVRERRRPHKERAAAWRSSHPGYDSRWCEKNQEKRRASWRKFHHATGKLSRRYKKISGMVEAGGQVPDAYLDLAEAIEIFKSQGNAFDFLTEA